MKFGMGRRATTEGMMDFYHVNSITRRVGTLNMEMEPAVSQFVTQRSSLSVETPCCWNLAFFWLDKERGGGGTSVNAGFANAASRIGAVLNR